MIRAPLAQAVRLLSVLPLVLLCVGTPYADTPAEPRPDTPQDQDRSPVIIDDTFDVVPITVSVTDGRGRFVPGLTQDDFELLEDGVAQDISSFSHDTTPLTTVLLIDTSGSMKDQLPLVRAAAARYVQTLGAQDLTKIVGFNERVTTIADYTADRETLQTAIAGIEVGGATALLNALYFAVRDLNARKKNDEMRRRAVVVLSDGDDTSSALTDDAVITAARRVDASVYAVRLRPERQAFGSAVEREEDKPGTRFLGELATETGGRLLVTTISQLDRIYQNVAEELRNQYTLGYLSSNPARDARFRRVVVRVKRQKNLRLRYKEGYYAVR